MKQPVLVVMAAGQKSWHDGLKLIDPVDSQENAIMDFSVYDAIKAGFSEIVFIINRENESRFRSKIDRTISKYVKVHYVYQELYDLPEGYLVPEGRKKPWGTGYAVLSCIYELKGAPFAVINADDFYGRQAFTLMYDQLSSRQDDLDQYHYAMVGYRLKNALTKAGAVSRRICQLDQNGYLNEINEYHFIEKKDGRFLYTQDGGDSFRLISADVIVSMNFWGFTDSFLDELQSRFLKFLNKDVQKAPLNAEYFLPAVVNELIREGKADVAVLPSDEHWYGGINSENKAAAADAISEMKKSGLYPKNLWN
ncbi:nucleotidyltransferase [Blautia liquoris]|uniref:Nucleotidyltransferase n=1 Tax=Blautia liquoris TaxID=2779518 RepID=A0A7M2RFA5_9FIRM|nr:sugar phosphate nucleotidyltransferase [Blautia liquoris]QOV18257.1 nucleotidyltransferase [Blautia liquoris]